jgi:hypothetical protein
MDKPIGTMISILLLLLTATTTALPQSTLEGFEESGPFSEQVRWMQLDSGVRVFVNAPAELEADRRVLVLYATPNGNTLEQTLGSASGPDRDWHFDIQHVAAQVRRLREIDTTQDVVLAVVQAPKLSWPAFRRDEPNAGKIIRQLVTSLAEECSADAVVLACHSGGGSFLWGYMNEFDAIPPIIERIVFLDANYSYSDEDQHGDKLLAWLDGDSKRHLVVVAYDDREITYKGKKVVGPDGGTFRASGRMLDRFRRDVRMIEQEQGPFWHTKGMAGQIQFYVHPNADNKILHTALVGEMNGLLHALTVGTEVEEKWGRFGGPRAYTKWVQSEPFVEPKEASPEIPPGTPQVRLDLPKRPDDAPTGSQFVELIGDLTLGEREAAVVREVLRGNVPEFLRQLKPIALAATDDTGNRHIAVCFVMPDYVGVGTDADLFRFPLTPRAAMEIADALDCTLITPRVSDAVHGAAEVKLQPRPLTQDRETVATFYYHHQLIEEQRDGKPAGLLVSGIKKDIVWTNRLKEKPHKLALYGWHYPNGRPIQSVYVGHWDRYVDYSHGVRLMANRIIVDGHELLVVDVLKDRELCGLISGEGVIDTAGVMESVGWGRPTVRRPDRDRRCRQEGV